MLPRHARLLQTLSLPRAAVTYSPTMGNPRPSQNSRTSEERRGAGDAACASAELGLVRASGAGCGENADRKWEPDGAGSGTGTAERSRSGHGPIEAFVRREETWEVKNMLAWRSETDAQTEVANVLLGLYWLDPAGS